MLTPQQAKEMSNELLDLYSHMEHDLIFNIAKKVNIMSTAPVDMATWQVEKLSQLGGLNQQNIKTIAEYSSRYPDELVAMFNKMGIKTLDTDETIYKKAQGAGLLKRVPVPANSSPAIQRIIKQTVANTGEYLNLVNTTAQQACGVAYRKAINQTYLETITGVSTYQEAIKKAVQKMADYGITGATYKSEAGKVTRCQLDVAVRRGIMTSSAQLTGGVQIERAKDWGANLVEVTSHMGARPAHAVWQGKIYSLDGSTDGYPNLAEETGYGTGAGLKGYNCKHDFYPYFPGISEQTYKPYPITANNEQYANEQIQRGLERDIRQQKRRITAAEGAGDTDGATAAKKALKNKQAQMRAHIEKTGLDRKPGREFVAKTDKGLPPKPTPPKAGPPKPTPPKVAPPVNPGQGTSPKAWRERMTEQARIKAQGMNMDTITAVYSKEAAEFVTKQLVAAPDNCKKVWNAYADKIAFSDTATRGGAYYRPSTGQICLNVARDTAKDGVRGMKAQGNTTFHEIGHLFDSEAARASGAGVRGDFSQMWHNHKFPDTLKMEAQGHVKRHAAAIKQELAAGDAHAEELQAQMRYSSLTQEATKRMTQELYSLKRQAVDLSDVFEGATSGRVRAAYGHGKSYWKRSIDGDLQATEAFAEMYSATVTDPESLAGFKKYFPESYKQFLQILDDMVNI